VDGGAAGALAVVGAVPGPAWELAGALAGLGEEAVVVGPPGASAPQAGPHVHVAGAWDRVSPEGLGASLSACGDSLPALRAAVWAWAPPRATEPAPFESLDEAAWEEAAEQPIRQCLAFLQGSHAHFAGRPGAIVVLLPTLCLLGPPPGLVAWATAAEGQRTLTKSAARNWGHAGIRAHVVAVTADLLAGPAPVGSTRRRPGLPPDALEEPATMEEVARVVATITGPQFRAATGGTVAVDGGQWMAP
jgi:3-oxoacyl-[acyl-carrier protein] reductase